LTNDVIIVSGGPVVCRYVCMRVCVCVYVGLTMVVHTTS
jgi:hypothetical protein